MKVITIHCVFCKKEFSRTTQRVNEAKRNNWKQFCSFDCRDKIKFTGTTLTCANKNCDNTFYRMLSAQKKVRKSFCSHSCSASATNAERNASLPLRICAKSTCNIRVSGENKYCSFAHAIEQRRIPEEKYKEKLILKIKHFYTQEGRIPVKREMYGTYRTARELFGTWNKMIEATGLQPNPVLFAEKQIAKDGHQCDSMAEKIIDDWLFSKDISHQRNIHYPNSHYTADFLIHNTFVEYFGLVGELKEYDNTAYNKEALAKKHNLTLIKIYPKDLFPKNKLEKILAGKT